MKYSVRVTKCYLVQVIDAEGNEVACDYVFAQNKKEAENRGELLVKAVREVDEECCKCGYLDCIFNLPEYQRVCDKCVDGSEYDDEDK